MNLRSQKRLASNILKIGENRVWIDPDRLEDVEEAVTRDEIRRLIKEGTIKAKPQKGISRGRTRISDEKRKKGRRKGFGSRTGKITANVSRKEAWINHIRAIRAHLKHLRLRRVIQKDVYRRLYILAKGGIFRDINHLERYIEDNNLRRRR